jgi:hypothetical protein
VTDLTPLKGMPLTVLNCRGTRVSDLSPLTGMPLKKLGCDFRPDRDLAILRSLKPLEQINKKQRRNSGRKWAIRSPEYAGGCQKETGEGQ